MHTRRGKLEQVEEMHGESNCYESFSKGIAVFETNTYIKQHGRWWLESRCAKETPKTLAIDTLWLWERYYHRTFGSKGITRVFAFFAKGRYLECTVTGCRKYSADLAQGKLEVPSTSPLSSFQGNTYGTCGFRKPVAWPKVDITEPTTKSQVWASSANTWNGTQNISHHNVLLFTVEKNCCRKYFVRLIFVALCDYKNF